MKKYHKRVVGDFAIDLTGADTLSPERPTLSFGEGSLEHEQMLKEIEAGEAKIIVEFLDASEVVVPEITVSELSAQIDALKVRLDAAGL